MNTEVLGVIAQIVLMVVLSYPLGKYIAKVYKGEKTCFSFLFLDLLEPVYTFKEKPKASYAAQGTNRKSD